MCFDVSQCSVLGPLLFTVHCLGLDDIFKHHQLQYHMYADDTQLYVEFPEISKFPQHLLLTANRCVSPM